MQKFEYGEQVKTGYALHALVTRFYRDRKREYCLLALRKIGFNPDRIMRAAFQKMLRASGVNVERAFLQWKMNHLSTDRNRIKQARRDIAAANLGNCLDKKRKNHLRSALKPIAADVAQTKAREKIVGRLSFACFGRMQQSFDSWKYHVFAHLAAAIEKKKAKIIDDLIRNAMSPL
jgi:hypothetical protein